jgi:hypothetical protein
MDYALSGVRQSRSGARWVTEATVSKRGRYAHPIAVGVRTSAGWTTARITVPGPDDQVVRIATDREPLEVRLDPHHFSWDWDRRNDVEDSSPLVNVDWPFLRQAHRERTVALIRPLFWYGEPASVVPALRVRSSYLDLVDRYEFGMAYATGGGLTLASQLQGWARVENPYLPFFARPLMGWGASAGKLDDVIVADGSHVVQFRGGTSGWFGGRITFSEAIEGVQSSLVPESWSNRSAVDYALDLHPRWRRGSSELFVDAQGVLGVHAGSHFNRAQLAAGVVRAAGSNELRVRGFVGTTGGMTPGQRALLLSSQDAVSTYRHHWWRPRMSLLKQDGVNGLPLGGAGLRGFDWRIAVNSVAASNLDLSRVLWRGQGANALAWRLHGFADAASAGGTVSELLYDAGIGLSVRGQLFDRPIALRLDAPLVVSHPELARDGAPTHERIRFRYALTFTDIWPD